MGVSGHLDWTSPLGEFRVDHGYRESQSAEDYSGVGTSYVFSEFGQPGVHADLDHPGTFTQELRYAVQVEVCDFVSAYITSRGTATAIWSAARLPRRPVRCDQRNLGSESRSQAMRPIWDGVIHLLPVLVSRLAARYPSIANSIACADRSELLREQLYLFRFEQTLE